MFVSPAFVHTVLRKYSPLTTVFLKVFFNNNFFLLLKTFYKLNFHKIVCIKLCYFSIQIISTVLPSISPIILVFRFPNILFLNRRVIQSFFLLFYLILILYFFNIISCSLKIGLTSLPETQLVIAKAILVLQKKRKQ